jgi:hypothetical protein
MFASREVGPRGSLEQMKAICYCLRNRVRAGWHEGSWIAAIEHADEVAAHHPETPSYFDPNSRSIQRLMSEIDDIFYGQRITNDDEGNGGGLEDSIGKQMFWMFLDRPVTEWFVKHIVRDMENHPTHAQMGLMMFFE